MNTQRDIVRQVITYIESNLETDLDLEKIAASAGYSRFHLNRIFAGETGCTIYKYLQARRLTSAAEKLATTDTPIAQIACESGYSSQQAFSLAFKRVYLCSPKVYRDRGIFIPRQNRLSLCASSGLFVMSGTGRAAITGRIAA